VADRANGGVAFVLGSADGAVLGRIEIRGTPEAAVDWTGRRLVSFCDSELVSYDLESLREQWRVPIQDRSITKAPGGLPALAAGTDGRFIFVLHYRGLRPGDANAPGASLSWLTAHDAATGFERGRVDFPDCVAARVLPAAGGGAYVLCRDELHAIDPARWSVSRRFSFPSRTGPIGVVADRAVYGVTDDLELQRLDLGTGVTGRGSKVGGKATSQAWGRLTMAPSGRSLWVIARRGDRTTYDPNVLAVIDLQSPSVFEMDLPGLRGVGFAGTRAVYAIGGTLKSLDGAIDASLVPERVDYWHIFGEDPLR
jgi:hypothetical protein